MSDDPREAVKQELLAIASTREKLEAELGVCRELCGGIAEHVARGKLLQRQLREHLGRVQYVMGYLAESRDRLQARLDGDADWWKG